VHEYVDDVTMPTQIIKYNQEEFEDTKGGNQHPYIEEEQTTQWPKKKYKRTNNDLQNIHIKQKIE
jgi:hypothetical protein